ncbi:MAG: alpha-amylase family glycosyl hydrolase [Candidatus Hydrogenedentota bacterium]
MKKILLLFLFLLPKSIFSIEPPIYFIMIDRFCNADKSNDYNNDITNPNAYQGGDLKGVISKLKYLKSLGVKTIWLSPVMDNRDNDFFGSYGYHGYWIKDFKKVDEHFGTMEDLKELVNEAHIMGISIILDIVLNHTDWDCELKAKHPHWFHNRGDIKNWNNREEVEEGNLTGLPDFNQDIIEVYDFCLDIASFWYKETGCDGFRFDAVKHIPHRFWKNFLIDLRKLVSNDFYFLAEVISGDPSCVSEYLEDGFDGIFDFPLYYRLLETFKNNESAKKVTTILKGDSIYKNKNSLNPFLGNHDTERFYNNNITLQKYKNALSLIFVLRGIPVIYYGEEVPLSQDTKFGSRNIMEFRENPQIFYHLQRLSHIKNNSLALKYGEQEIILQEDNVIGILRYLDNEEVFAFTNTADNIGTYTFSLPLNSFIIPQNKFKVLYGMGDISIEEANKVRVGIYPNVTFIVQTFVNKKRKKKILSELIEVEIVIEECITNWGENVFLIGNTDILGNFDINKAYGPLTCPNYPSWRCKIKLCLNEEIKIQPVVLDSTGKLLKQGKVSSFVLTDKNQIIKIKFSGQRY